MRKPHTWYFRGDVVSVVSRRLRHRRKSELKRKGKKNYGHARVLSTEYLVLLSMPFCAAGAAVLPVITSAVIYGTRMSYLPTIRLMVLYHMVRIIREYYILMAKYELSDYRQRSSLRFEPLMIELRVSERKRLLVIAPHTRGGTEHTHIFRGSFQAVSEARSRGFEI